MKHRDAIDGLRAVAVVPVVLAHAGFTWFQGGFVGVDVFFVISGYLITRIIVADLEQERFSLRSFYERRARRILPALFFVMLCCVPFAWAWMLPWQFKDFSQSLVAVSLFFSNVLFWMKSGYFGPAAQEMPLLHTWSLAVEEQFYLLFPLFLLLAFRRGRKVTVALIAVVALGSFLLSEVGSRAFASANFYLTPTRVWELMAGSLCAFLPAGKIEEIARRYGNLLSGAGLAMILAAVLAFDETTRFPSAFALLPVGGAALVILFATRDTLTARLLSTRPFVAVGLVSYSAYLWHQPLFAFARIRSDAAPGIGSMAVLALATFVLAYLTWRFVEQPFRAGRGRPAWLSPRQVFSASVTGAAALVGIGLFGHLSNGRQELWLQTVSPERGQTYLLVQHARNEGFSIVPDDGKCRFNVTRLDQSARDRILDCHRTHPNGTLILGDSHAGNLFGAIAPEAPESFVVGLTAGFCRAHSPSPACDYEAIRDFASEHPTVFNDIIYNQAGFYLLKTLEGAPGRRTMFSDLGPLDPVPSYPPNDDYITRVADYLAGFPLQADVLWLGPALEPHIGDRQILRTGCDQAFQLRPNLEAVFAALDGRIAAHFADRPADTGVRYVSQMALTQFDVAEDFMDCERLYWSDGDHWSADGQKRFGPEITARLFDAQAMSEAMAK
ncbi:MAG: acyltransferase family protein [Aurantimonas endophytica]|uniref:acyltransferase family protein n=1 Tax=Aurantimonas endophytica TaxID=1522175 RepID=UPI0030036AF2